MFISSPLELPSPGSTNNFTNREQLSSNNDAGQYHTHNLTRKHLEDVTNNYEPQIMQNMDYDSSPSESMVLRGNETNGNRNGNEGITKPIIISASSTDPNSIDEMEKKKERIMLMSLQRRQQQEEAKAVKEANEMRRREKEQMKEDEKMRKKEEQAARRQAILEAHKLKKAIEEAEREGKVIDKADLLLLKQTQQQLQVNSSTVRRPQKTIRPRPKTIHIESGSVDMGDNMSSAPPSRIKKGSNTNLAGEYMGKVDREKVDFCYIKFFFLFFLCSYAMQHEYLHYHA